MIAFAIDQKQGLVGTQTAQRRWVNVVCCVCPRLAIGVETRREIVQDLVQFDVARLVYNVFDGNNVDRNGRFARLPRLVTRTDNNGCNRSESRLFLDNNVKKARFIKSAKFKSTQK